MEEGSLLSEALKHETTTASTLLIDVYLAEFNDPSVDHLLALASTAVEINAYIQGQSKGYPWMQGGDGPVFGVHISDSSQPHLRCECRYGASVADEWNIIGLILKFTEAKQNLLVESHDIDDGQILLIQAAEYLPTWVDRIGSEQCRHRCWIHGGKVDLIEPGIDQSFLSLSDALKILRREVARVGTQEEITKCIRETVAKVNDSQHFHRAPIVLPRPVAQLIQHRPDLVAVLAGNFLDTIHDVLPKKSKFTMALEEEWIWTTHKFGRTSYAMLRSSVASPDWKTETSIPYRYQSPQVKRLQRQCQNQTTPHLIHGLQLGVRLVAGLDAILRHGEKISKRMDRLKQDIPRTIESRVTHLWTQLDLHYRTHDCSWIQKAWTDGPNKASHDLSNIIKCPVFEFEVQNAVTPLSQPTKSLEEQIRQELKSEGKLSGPEQEDPLIPPASEFDDEDWMVFPSEAEISTLLGMETNENATEIASQEGIKSMLEGFQGFLTGQGTHEGVLNENSQQGSQKGSGNGNSFTSLSINSKVCLNLLQSTLKAKSGEDVSLLLLPSNGGDDGFFSAEDYEMGGNDSGDEDDAEENETDTMAVSIMDAMDRELAERTTDRTKDSVIDEADEPDHASNNEAFNDDVHLLTNLVRSLEVSAGGPGPVKNVLTAMGKATPRVEEANSDSS